MVNRIKENLMVIKKANREDLKALLALYEKSRQVMKKTGNPNQWGDHYPSEERLEKDLARESLYKVLANDQIIGGFMFGLGPEEEYKSLEGNWLNESPYSVIHRITAPEAKGVTREIFAWAKKQTDNLRIDTHKDNVIMRHILEREGFTYVGEITLADGSRRMAYHIISS